MRKSPDGQKDLYEAAGSLRPRYGQIVLMYGEGLAPKAGIGVPEIEDSYWLEMVNRFRTGPARYDRIERLRFGVVALADTPIQQHDHYMTMDGADFHHGTGEPKIDEKALELGHRTVDELDRYPSSAPVWLVRHQGGSLLVQVPGDVDSGCVAEQLKDFFVGDFSLEAVNGGQFTAADPPVAPGWNQVLAPSEDAPPPANSRPEMAPA